MNRCPRLYRIGPLSPGQEWQPDREQSRHLLRVLRLKGGQSLEVLNGAGQCAEATLHQSAEGIRIAVDCVTEQDRQTPQIIFWFPAIRSSRLEQAIEKLTELGVAQIRIYLSDHTGNRDRKIDLPRLRRICEAALLQSGNCWMPELSAGHSLDELLMAHSGALIMADQNGQVPDPDYRSKLRRVTLLCGPEGGFSPAESQTLIDTASLRIAFGQTILRAETAAIALTALLRCYPVAP